MASLPNTPAGTMMVDPLFLLRKASVILRKASPTLSLNVGIKTTSFQFVTQFLDAFEYLVNTMTLPDHQVLRFCLSENKI